MDLSASSRLITSALTSLEIPPHEYEEDVRDEIHLDGGKDDNGSSPAITQDPSKEQHLSNSMNSSLIIPVPTLHFSSSTPVNSHQTSNGSSEQFCYTGNNSLEASMISPNGSVDVASQSTGDLVLAAISVMKGRKARPDTKRLCNWVHRKYGRSVQDVVNEIDSLCDQGVLEKVEYKGSISFRIVSDKKLHKRAGRRKSNNDNTNQSKQETPRKANGAKKSPKKIVEKSPDSSCQPLTINFIVTEQLKPGPDTVINKTDIINAIETSARPINKKNVFRDLETILAQEIHLGYLKKVSDDGYTLSSIENSKTYRGTIALKVSKRKPKPTQKMLEMEADKTPNKVKCEKMDEIPDLENNENKVPLQRTEDQLKDDLIKEKLISSKLFRMKNKIKATKSKMRKDKLNSVIHSELKPLENGIDELHEKQINLKYSIEEVLESTEDFSKNEDKTEESKKVKKKKETWQTSDIKKAKLSTDKERKNVFVEKPDPENKRKRKKKVVDSGTQPSVGRPPVKRNESQSNSKQRTSQKLNKKQQNRASETVADDDDDRSSTDGPQRTASARKKVR